MQMPITSSAKKALRASGNKAVYNARRKDAISDTVKKIKKLITEKKVKEAEALLATAYQDRQPNQTCSTSKTHALATITQEREKVNQ